MRAFRKPDTTGGALLERSRLNRRLFLMLAGAAGLPLVAPGIFGRAVALNAPAIPPVDAAAPDITRTATFAMG